MKIGELDDSKCEASKQLQLFWVIQAVLANKNRALSGDFND